MTDTWTAEQAADLIDSWVAKLRSGIKQGHGALMDEKGGRCCLGVLGELCGLQATGKQRDGKHVYINPNDPAARGNFTDTPPSSITNKVGLTSAGAILYAKGRQGERDRFKDKDGKKLRYFTGLAEANDGGKSFDDIADIIEANKDLLVERSQSFDDYDKNM